MGLSRVALDELADTPNLEPFIETAVDLKKMRYVVNAVNDAKTVLVTDDPYEYLGAIMRSFKNAPQGFYAIVAIDEDTPSEPDPVEEPA